VFTAQSLQLLTQIECFCATKLFHFSIRSSSDVITHALYAYAQGRDSNAAGREKSDF
jgi:hypothetical protein